MDRITQRRLEHEIDKLRRGVRGPKGSTGPTGPAGTDGVATFQQGYFVEATTTGEYVYTGYGVDGDWEARRHGSTGEYSTGTGQTGPKPTTLSAFQALSYPNLIP